MRYKPPLWLLAVMAVLTGATLLRAACLSSEFWLDEIWSWRLARAAGSPAGVFVIRHDNNHVLNSLWLRLWPATAAWSTLRLHSFCASLIAVALAALAGRRRGRAEAVFAALLVAGCSWLVFASAEARGYALAVCLALAAFASLWRYLDTARPLPRGLFWVCSILGFLSHLSFVHAYIGFVVWSMRRFGQSRHSQIQKRSSLYEIRQMLLCHGPVIVFFVSFYFVTIRNMEIGGGPPATPIDVLRRLFSLGLGGPAEGFLSWLLVGTAIAVVVRGLYLLRRGGSDVWVFFLTTIVASPALFLLRPPTMLFERYFLISFVFFLFLLAFVLGDLWRQVAWRPLVVLALGAFLTGNLLQVRSFTEAGRGEFESALAWIAEHDRSDVIPVAGSLDDGFARLDDFRVEMYADFYARRQESSRILYVKAEHSCQARWLLLHRSADDPRPEPGAKVDVLGNEFILAKEYPRRGRMDWAWYVYRRAGSERQ